MNAHKAALTLLVVLAFGLIAWVVEMLVDRYWPDLGVMGRIFLMAVLALGFSLAAVQPGGGVTS